MSIDSYNQSVYRNFQNCSEKENYKCIITAIFHNYNVGDEQNLNGQIEPLKSFHLTETIQF